MKMCYPIGIPNSNYARMIPVKVGCEILSAKESTSLNWTIFRIFTALEENEFNIFLILAFFS